MKIIQDTREKTPWAFAEDQDVIVCKLDVGDYSVEGLEYKLCVERKASVGELANNIGQKRFHREIDKMADYELKFLVLEFNVDDVLMYPVGSDIPKKVWGKLRINTKYIMKYLSDLQVHKGIHVVFAGDADNATYIGWNIMKRAYEKYIDKYDSS